MARPIVLVSNRGPVSFDIDHDGEMAVRRGAGGLVSGLGPLIGGTDARWFAAAMTDGDRQMAEKGVVDAEGFRLRLLAVDPDVYRMAYDVIGNATLWFLHHGLWELARRPVFDTRWQEAWQGYRAYNHAFAEAIAADAPPDAAVLVQDYHLGLVAAVLRDRRPDLRLVHFAHTPFAGPDACRILPTAAGRELLAGLGAHHACGFHTERWAAAYRASAEELGTAPAPTFVSPLAPDGDDVRATASSARCQQELDDLDERLGGRQLITRVDRIELSKNLLRGFLAYDDLLDRHPEWRERVVFGAFVYPSREGLPEYLAYRQEVETVVERVNGRWQTEGWTPILLDLSDDYPRSVAALRRYDVLLVNPVRDGLNLVAKEGPLVNERAGTVLLSTEAGAWDELQGTVVDVNPFDVSATADQLAAALAESRADREQRAAALRARCEARSPADWLEDQLRAAES